VQIHIVYWPIEYHLNKMVDVEQIGNLPDIHPGLLNR